MKCFPDNLKKSRSPSEAARHRMLAVRGEPLFYADWLRAMFVHYEVDAGVLQRATPFELDLDADGRAYVSLVAFTMRGVRPRIGGRLTEILFRPIATHEFLNVRTYVKHGGEPGIYFLAEWLANPLSVLLGPLSFGLPYRHGRFAYEHRPEQGRLRGIVTTPDKTARLEYHAPVPGNLPFQPSVRGSQEEFLIERFTAFTERNGCRRFFRIWHPPWLQIPVSIKIVDQSLLTDTWPWFKSARLLGANYSPGLERVWMGRPHRCA